MRFTLSCRQTGGVGDALAQVDLHPSATGRWHWARIERWAQLRPFRAPGEPAVPRLALPECRRSAAERCLEQRFEDGRAASLVVPSMHVEGIRKWRAYDGDWGRSPTSSGALMSSARARGVCRPCWLRRPRPLEVVGARGQWGEGFARSSRWAAAGRCGITQDAPVTVFGQVRNSDHRGK